MLKQRYLDKQRNTDCVSVNPSFPKILKIDICNTCNYNCVICPQSKQMEKKGCIDDYLCRKIIEDAFLAGARELCLSMTGEPLINKRLEEYIFFAKKIGYNYVFFNTNGYLCDKSRAISLIDSGVDSIKFSINADKKSYELIHGVDGYDIVIDNLRNIFEYRNKVCSSCRIYVSYVAVRQTIQEAELLKNKVSNICDEVLIMNANNRAGSISELDKDLFLGLDEYAFKYPCSQPFNNAYVTAEGYMIICCQDFENYTVVSDLNKEDIVSAWNNEAFTSFRKRYLNGDFKGILCENCLCNCNNKVEPFDRAFAGYIESEAKKKDLDNRILILTNGSDK